MITVKRLIGLALQEIGAVSAGEEPRAEDVADALDYLKMMLAAWSIEHLLVPFVTREEFTLLGQRIVSIGPGGDYDTIRPEVIKALVILDGSNTEHYVEPLAQNLMNQLSTKDTQTDYPRWYSYEPNWPLGRIEFSAIPKPGYTMRIESHKPITQDIVLTEKMNLPDNFTRLVLYGLAIEISKGYGRPVDAELASKFRYSWTTTKRQQAASRVPSLEMDAALQQPKRYDIESGP